MNGRTVRRAAALAATGLALGAVTGWLAPAADPMPLAGASLPTGAPVFSNPLEIDHEFFPVRPGAIKLFTGKDGREDVTIVEFHLVATRTFTWNAVAIECRAIRESTFIDGNIFETSLNWYAQADDGSVYFFGEVSYEGLVPADTADAEEQGVFGWVVGDPQPGDPAGTETSPGPFLFMPANVEPGDVWKPEDLGTVVDETDEAIRIDRRIRVPAGRFTDCLRVVDTSALDPGEETKWYAPGQGVIKARSRGEISRLLASTLGTQ